MKFKKDKACHAGVRAVELKDRDGDRLTFETSCSFDNTLYARVNGGVGVRLTKGKALKLAYAILAELEPDYDL